MRSTQSSNQLVVLGPDRKLGEGRGPGLRYRSVRLSRGVGPAWSLLQHLTLHWIDAEIETAITALGREPEGGLVIMPGVFMFAYRNLSGQPIAARPAYGRKWQVLYTITVLSLALSQGGAASSTLPIHPAPPR